MSENEELKVGVWLTMEQVAPDWVDFHNDDDPPDDLEILVELLEDLPQEEIDRMHIIEANLDDHKLEVKACMWESPRLLPHFKKSLGEAGWWITSWERCEHCPTPIATERRSRGN